MHHDFSDSAAGRKKFPGPSRHRKFNTITPSEKKLRCLPNNPHEPFRFVKLMAPQAGKKKMEKWEHGAGPFRNKLGQLIAIPGKWPHGGTKKLNKCDHSESNSGDQRHSSMQNGTLNTRLKQPTKSFPRAPLSPLHWIEYLLQLFIFIPQISVSGQSLE
jgi:hypothetical protein